jgi:hypothetical protein
VAHFVGRNSGLDSVRRRRKETALPSEEVLSDDDDAEASLGPEYLGVEVERGVTFRSYPVKNELRSSARSYGEAQ